MARLAFYTFGILHEPYGHERTQGFVDRAQGVFDSAEATDGFVDRSRRDPDTNEHSWQPFASPRFYIEGEHAGAPTTLSLWDDLESVFAFAYYGAHGEALSKRKDWFVPPEWPTYVAWWVDDDHRPCWEEASARHEQLHDQGPTPGAFTFKKAFTPEGDPLEIDRECIAEKRKTVKGG